MPSVSVQLPEARQAAKETPRARGNEAWRTVLLALSFANLAYLRVWQELLMGSGPGLFFRKSAAAQGQYSAAMADVLALAGVAYGTMRIARRLPAWLRSLLLLAAIALVASALRAFAGEYVPNLRSGLFRFVEPRHVFVALWLAALMLAGAVFRFYSPAARMARACAMAALPCVLVTFGDAAWRVVRPPTSQPEPPLAVHLDGRPAVRVLWIVFDEWDQRLTFPFRRDGMRLPAVDNLAATSFTAERALTAEAGVPVAGMATVVSMPSLIYGKRVRAERQASPGQLDLTFADGSSTRFGAGSTLFSQARARGWNAAIGGWYLPYCRVFSNELTDCYWDQMYTPATSLSPDFADAARDEARQLFESSLFSLFGQSLTLGRHAREYSAILAFARRIAADPSIGVALIHFNIPHAPHFYNPATGNFDRRGYDPNAGYDDALALVDRTIGLVLESLRHAGLDGRTALVLSSDHPARFPTRIDGGEDPHVPFLVHFPGREDGLVERAEFSVLLTPRTIMEIAAGTIRSPRELAGFLRTADNAP